MRTGSPKTSNSATTNRVVRGRSCREADALAGKVVRHGSHAFADNDQLVVEDLNRNQIDRHAQLPARLFAAIFGTLQLPLAERTLGILRSEAADKFVAAMNGPHRIGNLAGCRRLPVVLERSGVGSRHEAQYRANVISILAGAVDAPGRPLPHGRSPANLRSATGPRRAPALSANQNSHLDENAPGSSRRLRHLAPPLLPGNNIREGSPLPASHPVVRR